MGVVERAQHYAAPQFPFTDLDSANPFWDGLVVWLLTGEAVVGVTVDIFVVFFIVVGVRERGGGLCVDMIEVHLGVCGQSESPFVRRVALCEGAKCKGTLVSDCGWFLGVAADDVGGRDR